MVFCGTKDLSAKSSKKTLDKKNCFATKSLYFYYESVSFNALCFNFLA